MTDVLQPPATEDIASTGTGAAASAAIATATDWPEGIPRHMTLEEFLAWDQEGLRAEWVDGEVVIVSPVRLAHQFLLLFLYEIIAIHARRHRLGRVLVAPVRMVIPDRPSSREPDLLFVATAHLDRLKTTYVDGPADLVIEVVSPESDLRDRATKFLEYEAAGIPEYWLVDPLRQEVVFNQLGADGRYHPGVVADSGIYTSHVLEGFRLRLEWLWQDPPPDPDDAIAELSRS